MRNGRTQFRLTAWWLLVSSSHNVWGVYGFIFLCLALFALGAPRGVLGVFYRGYPSWMCVTSIHEYWVFYSQIWKWKWNWNWNWKFFEFQYWSLNRHSVVIVFLSSFFRSRGFLHLIHFDGSWRWDYIGTFDQVNLKNIQVFIKLTFGVISDQINSPNLLSYV